MQESAHKALHYLEIVCEIVYSLGIQKLKQKGREYQMYTVQTNLLTVHNIKLGLCSHQMYAYICPIPLRCTYLPDDVGWLQLSYGEDVLSNGPIIVTLAVCVCRQQGLHQEKLFAFNFDDLYQMWMKK